MAWSSTAFESFYVAYRAQHAQPANRALHLLAKILALACLGAAFSRQSLAALLAAPVLAVAPCWIGHLLFERNRPASWDDPATSVLGTLARLLQRGNAGRSGRWYYSVLADLRMCAEMVGLARAGAASERA